MAQKPHKPRTNRYKNENGKGATALAVFVVLVLTILVGGYYFFAWQQKQEPVVRLQQQAPLVTAPVLPSPPVPPVSDVPALI